MGRFIHLAIGLIIAFGFAFAFTGCSGGDTIYHKTHSFEQQTWSYSDTVHFSFDIQDTTAKYNLYLDVVHSDTFPFQNLYLNLFSKTPTDEIVKDQHSLELQEKDGYWISECSGHTCELRFILRENLTFPAVGSYTISAEQYTREENLRGIQSLGLFLEKAKKQ